MRILAFYGLCEFGGGIIYPGWDGGGMEIAGAGREEPRKSSKRGHVCPQCGVPFGYSPVVGGYCSFECGAKGEGA